MQRTVLCSLTTFLLPLMVLGLLISSRRGIKNLGFVRRLLFGKIRNRALSPAIGVQPVVVEDPALTDIAEHLNIEQEKVVNRTARRLWIGKQG